MLAIASSGITNADAFVFPRQSSRFSGTKTLLSTGGAGEDKESPSGEFPRIIETSGVPIELLGDIEPEVIEQIRVLAESPVPVEAPYPDLPDDTHIFFAGETNTTHIKVIPPTWTFINLSDDGDDDY